MRRPLSIVIVALFFLAPLSVLLPGDTDAQVPACCRRNGKHHCAMMAAGSVQPVFGTHQLTAPSRCPLYRSGTLAVTPVFAIFHAPSAANPASTRLASARSSAVTVYRARIASSRGPPLAG
ncbi:MAG TPA: hypothetical protein VG225_17545 [Terracidiphilus sp.]|nr:hypothetical protein [Terracidiphilus sp.]